MEHCGTLVHVISLYSCVFFFYSPGPGPLVSIQNTTSNSTIYLTFTEPIDKNAAKIEYSANVSFSYKLLCGQISTGTDIWQSMPNTEGSELRFTELESYSVYKVRAWASTLAGAGPIMEKLAYTTHGGKHHYMFYLMIALDLCIVYSMHKSLHLCIVYFECVFN